MRLTLQALGHILHIEIDADRPAPDQQRDRETDVYSTTERAPGWDHDRREPLGFRAGST